MFFLEQQGVDWVQGWESSRCRKCWGTDILSWSGITFAHLQQNLFFFSRIYSISIFSRAFTKPFFSWEFRKILYSLINQGVSANYFPYRNQGGYLSPAIFIQLTKPKSKCFYRYKNYKKIQRLKEEVGLYINKRLTTNFHKISIEKVYSNFQILLENSIFLTFFRCCRRCNDCYWVQSLCTKHRARFHGEKRAGTFWGKIKNKKI